METLLAAGTLNLLFALSQGEIETDRLACWHGCSAPSLSDLLGNSLVGPKLAFPFSFDCIGLEAVEPFLVSFGRCRARWFASGRRLRWSRLLGLLLCRCRKQCETHLIGFQGLLKFGVKGGYSGSIWSWFCVDFNKAAPRRSVSSEQLRHAASAIAHWRVSVQMIEEQLDVAVMFGESHDSCEIKGQSPTFE